MHRSVATTPEYFDIVEAGVYLGVVKAIPGDPDPARTQRNQLQVIYRWVRQGRIPYIKMGSRLYFQRAALDHAMRQGVHQSWHTTQALPESSIQSLKPSDE
jgi:excisionase family DNA binding protein